VDWDWNCHEAKGYKLKCPLGKWFEKKKEKWWEKEKRGEKEEKKEEVDDENKEEVEEVRVEEEGGCGEDKKEEEVWGGKKE